MNDQVSDTEAQAYEDNSEKIIYYPIHAIPNHPEWTDIFCVESRVTYQFLGFVGRIGWSKTYAYDDGLPGRRGKGRCQSLEEAIMKLAKAGGAL